MVRELEVAYPSQYEAEALLKDGSIIRLRPIRRDDCERWLKFVSRLSPRAKYLRFHHVPKETTPDDALRYCTVDYKSTFAIVAEVRREQREEIVGLGRYYRLPDKPSAEVAFAVEDDYQARGIGTRLMEVLVKAALENGITMFQAEVLADNQEIMGVFQNYGFHVTSELEAGVYHVAFPIAATRRAMKKEEERERMATLASLRPILLPRSVAVIGASRQPGTIGYLLLQCLIENRFSGVVYPVNPNAEAVMSVKAYPSVLEVPGDVDLAVIAVPAPIVSRVADECGRKGVRAMVVISDGFKERGREGAAREEELRDIALGYGMRLVGPNCMGVLNTDPAIGLNATFSQVYPPQGNVAFLTQSGALGLAILQYASNLNIGISSFISVGNRADVSSNDLLQYWEQDPATRVVLLYLESFGNPRKFGRIARRVSAAKPIVAVKGGSTPAGSRAAMSHTGALATSDVASDALFRQSGLIRVNTLEELFDVATLLSTQPVPKGRSVVIVTNGGGPGILAADACDNRGLLLPEFSPETVGRLKSVIKRDITVHNPLDLTAGASEEEFAETLKVLAADPGNDAVILIFVPPVIVSLEAIETAVGPVATVFQRHQKPLLACFMGQRGFSRKLGYKDKFVPCYPFPEDAVSALAETVEYGEWRRKPKGSIPKLRGIKRERARRIIEGAMTRTAERPLWLGPQEIAELLHCYGIRLAETLVARTDAEAAALASRTGFPVAVKLVSSTITHKTDVGGVVLGLKSEKEVEKAWNRIRDSLARLGREREMEGVAVQRMVEGGIETIVGVTQDPSFGPLVMLGLGGVYTELFKDVVFRLHPLTDLDAGDLVGSIKMAKLFEGFRGAPPADTPALEDLLLRLSAIIEDVPQIAELDFNPVKVMPKGEGYWVIDARVLVK